MNEALCTITITVNERKKLFRYDEAVRLLRECEECDGEEWLTFVRRKVRAFLAADPQGEEGGR